MSMHIERIEASRYIAQAGDLLREHWQELTLFKDVAVLKPDVAKYEALENAGKLKSLGLFKEDVLVGYSVNILGTHPHYADLVCLVNDVLFVTKELRQGRRGLALIRATEQLAVACGAQVMTWHAKEGTTLDALMPKLGYAVQDISYSKEV
jgi:hypothetical protein